MDEMDLAQIRAGWVFAHANPVFHRYAQMRIVAHTQSGDQLDHRLVDLAETVFAVSADRDYLTLHARLPGFQSGPA
jgi:hypothetical protein